MASSVNIANTDLVNTFDVWRVRTNLSANDVNEVCRGNFVKPAGFVKIETGYLQLANATGQTLRVNADAGISGVLSVKKIEQDGVGSYIISDTGDVRFNNTASVIQFAGNTYTVRLFSNSIANLANTYNSGWLVIGGTTSNNSQILNVNNYLTVSNNSLLGNVTISSNLTVSKNTVMTGNVSIGSRANIAGTVNIASTLEVSGNTLLYANLAVTRNATVGGTLNVAQTLGVAGNTFLFANLAVNGTITQQDLKVSEISTNADIGLAGTRRIYIFPAATYKSGKLLIQVQSPDGGNTQLSEAVVTANLTLSHITVYGTVSTPPVAAQDSSLIGTFSTNVVTNNVEVYITTSFNNCKTKVFADLIK